MPYTSIREAAEEIHSGIITPTELVLETIEQIDAQESAIQAYITIMREQALIDAEKAEREMRTGLYRSPLHGIPIAIKDLIAVKEVRTTAGSKVLADHISHEDAMVVEQLRKNGAIIIGKTWTYEFAYGPYHHLAQSLGSYANNRRVQRWFGSNLSHPVCVFRRNRHRYGRIYSYSFGLLRRYWTQAHLWTCELLWRYPS